MVVGGLSNRYQVLGTATNKERKERERTGKEGRRGESHTGEEERETGHSWI